MDSFYTIVVSIAFILMIIILIVLGIMMQNQDADKLFPNQATPCPDGWGTSMINDKSACKIPSSGTNVPDNSRITANIGTDKVTTQPQTGYLSFNDVSICEKRDWTNDVGVSWDGVSNFNKCDV